MAYPASRDRARVPRQERGHRTRERILAATERLLRKARLEDLGVREIVREARASVGSFYHLFGSRDALVAPLYARYDTRITREARRVLDPARWRGRSLADRTSRLFRYAARLYRHERGLMRALVLHARGRPAEVTALQRRHRRDFWEDVIDLLLECRAEIAHPDPRRAVRLGLFVAGSAFRDKILFGDAPHPASLALDDRSLAAELTRVFLAYVRPLRGEEPHAVD